MDLIKLNESNDIINGQATVYNNKHRRMADDQTFNNPPDFALGRFLNGPWLDDNSFPAQGSGDINSSDTTADAVVYYDSQDGFTHSIRGFTWSYDSAPTNGEISIESPSGTIIYGPQPITSAGFGFKNFESMIGSRSDDFLVRLAAGSATGVVTVDGHRFV